MITPRWFKLVPFAYCLLFWVAYMLWGGVGALISTLFMVAFSIFIFYRYAQ